MDKILSLEQANELSQILHKQNKHIVLVGGCFDLLHIGHITFLEEARKQGEILVILLEADQTIAKSKGSNRPINTQNDRAKILAALTSVDYVIKLPDMMNDKSYDDLVITVKPAIIATTRGDKNRVYKERSAGLINAQVIDVTPQISDKSTTKLIKLLDEL